MLPPPPQTSRVRDLTKSEVARELQARILNGPSRPLQMQCGSARDRLAHAGDYSPVCWLLAARPPRWLFQQKDQPQPAPECKSFEDLTQVVPDGPLGDI